MAPNSKPIHLSHDTELIIPDTPQHDGDARLTEMLDKHADTGGLKSMNTDNEDWTDVKHSERKKRDRILDDGVLIKLMAKSDFKGFQRLFTNLGIMAVTAYAIHQLDIKLDGSLLLEHPAKALAFLFVYPFYGFQFQAFAFAGQHEFLHRNAFKTKWYNDVCLFLVGCFCFELGAHERVMHKQHHTYTNNIDKDPELTSYFTRDELERPGFRNIPLNRMDYFRGIFDIFDTLKMRAGRIFNSARGKAVDYSGFGWSLKEWNYSAESGIMRQIQRCAWGQIAFYICMFLIFGRSQAGLQNLAFWWICPVIVGYPVVNFFRNLEHADCEVSEVSNCLLNTRSVSSNLLVRVILWDTTFHAEHHCYPMVPFFNLHKISALMKGHVVHSEFSDFTTQHWNCIKPNGWIDTQHQEMMAREKASCHKSE